MNVYKTYQQHVSSVIVSGWRAAAVNHHVPVKLQYSWKFVILTA